MRDTPRMLIQSRWDMSYVSWVEFPSMLITWWHNKSFCKEKNKTKKNKISEIVSVNKGNLS